MAAQRVCRRVAVREWTFLFGPGFMAGFNALLLGTLLYRSRLVPRAIPTLGLIGAPLLFAASIATLFGHGEQASGLSMIAALPIAFWELSVGVWMVVKGFRPSPVTANLTQVD
jgi:ABC-type branched-subunit amino acid transport system permease subunit